VLQGYKGFLMTDAYCAYTKYGKQPGVTHQHCLSHGRRYFLYALENDAARAAYALDHFFGPLYAIEQECKLMQLDYDGITAKRQSESLPVLQALRQWLEAELPKTIARTPIYKAINYTLKNYDAFVQYTTDGMLPIDNYLNFLIMRSNQIILQVIRPFTAVLRLITSHNSCDHLANSFSI
jgi:hypothetical protein